MHWRTYRTSSGCGEAHRSEQDMEVHPLGHRGGSSECRVVSWAGHFAFEDAGKHGMKDPAEACAELIAEELAFSLLQQEAESDRILDESHSTLF